MLISIASVDDYMTLGSCLSLLRPTFYCKLQQTFDSTSRHAPAFVLAVEAQRRFCRSSLEIEAQHAISGRHPILLIQEGILKFPT